jgi:hypothetical protein
VVDGKELDANGRSKTHLFESELAEEVINVECTEGGYCVWSGDCALLPCLAMNQPMMAATGRHNPVAAPESSGMLGCVWLPPWN